MTCKFGGGRIECDTAHPAPVSPRVAEELLRECAEILRREFDTRGRSEQVATAIIILAQDTKLREVAELKRVLRRASDGFYELTAESRGVDGLHRNGDLATWTELLPGGRMEEWTAWLGEIESAIAGS